MEKERPANSLNIVVRKDMMVCGVIVNRVQWKASKKPTHIEKGFNSDKLIMITCPRAKGALLVGINLSFKVQAL